MSIKLTDKKARANYRKKVVPLRIELYPTDKDILEWLAQLDEPKATYIKRLIRKDMEKESEQ